MNRGRLVLTALGAVHGEWLLLLLLEGVLGRGQRARVMAIPKAVLVLLSGASQQQGRVSRPLPFSELHSSGHSCFLPHLPPLALAGALSHAILHLGPLQLVPPRPVGSPPRLPVWLRRCTQAQEMAGGARPSADLHHPGPSSHSAAPASWPSTWPPPRGCLEGKKGSAVSPQCFCSSPPSLSTRACCCQMHRSRAQLWGGGPMAPSWGPGTCEVGERWGVVGKAGRKG